LSYVAEALLSRVLDEAVNRVARKVSKGKKLSDQEIIILYLDIMTKTSDKRFNDLKEYVDVRHGDFKEYVDKRFDSIDNRLESLEKRVDLVYSEVSCIKTDIIKMMKEYMEKLYEEKKS
jgi:archaellum component FlaC